MIDILKEYIEESQKVDDIRHGVFDGTMLACFDEGIYFCGMVYHPHIKQFMMEDFFKSMDDDIDAPTPLVNVVNQGLIRYACYINGKWYMWTTIRPSDRCECGFMVYTPPRDVTKELVCYLASKLNNAEFVNNEMTCLVNMPI